MHRAVAFSEFAWSDTAQLDPEDAHGLCLHVLPELEALEAKFPQALTVIGVHSAKFPNEREAASLRHAIRRHQITHPIVNDAEFVIWQRYGVRAWPTLVLIDPAGYVIGAVAGEGHGPALAEQIEKLITEHRAAGTLREGPGPTATQDGADGSLLAFPGKVAVDPAGGRLAIADSGHHRVVVTDLHGTIRAVAGTGKRGAADGSFADAAFRHPQGLAFHEGHLYVADSEANAIRSIDPRPGGRIRTLVGVGLFDFGDQDGSGEGVRLQHPLGLAVQDGRIYIADTYNHKIKVRFPSLQRVETLFGTGRPGAAEGDRPQFFEPGGLAATPGRLYIADTNNHRICVADLSSKTVTALPLRGA